MDRAPDRAYPRLMLPSSAAPLLLLAAVFASGCDTGSSQEVDEADSVSDTTDGDPDGDGPEWVYTEYDVLSNTCPDLHPEPGAGMFEVPGPDTPSWPMAFDLVLASVGTLDARSPAALIGSIACEIDDLTKTAVTCSTTSAHHSSGPGFELTATVDGNFSMSSATSGGGHWLVSIDCEGSSCGTLCADCWPCGYNLGTSLAAP